jgi:hypothetical protein
VVTDPTAAVNVPVVDPAATTLLAGTVTAEFVLDRLTVKPPAGATALSVTVHVELPGAATVAGEHDNADGTTGARCRMVTVPPEPVVRILLPAAVVATVLLSWIAVLAASVPGAT